MKRFAFSLGVFAPALTFAVLACTQEPTTTVLDNNTPLSASTGSLDPVDVPAVVIDLPPVVRPWDIDDSALLRALVEADGYAVVGFKAPASRRAAEAAGLRAALTAGEVEAAMAVLRGRGVEILALYKSIGAALVRLSPGDAPLIRRLPIVDYFEPRSAVQPTVEITTLGSAAASPAVQHGMLAQTTPWGISMVRAPEAWTVTRGGGVKIGFISQLVEGHEDLPGVPCANYGGPYGYECGQYFFGLYTTGTFGAGIVAARDNTIGVVGVGPGIPGADVYVWVACDPRYSPRRHRVEHVRCDCRRRKRVSDGLI